MRKKLQEMIDLHGHGFCNIFALYAAKMKKLGCNAIIRYSDETEDDIGEGLPIPIPIPIPIAIPIAIAIAILIHAFVKLSQ